MSNKIEFQVLGDVKDFEKKISGVKKTFDDLGRFSGLALAGLTAATYKFIEAAREQEQAVNQLNQALKNQGNFSEDASKDLVRYADQLQNVSLFNDEAIISAQALIASFGFEGKTLKELTRATLDLAQAKGMDLASAADIVAKSVGGTANVLGRYGIAVEGVAGSNTRAASAIRGITELYGGQAEAATKGLGSTLQLKKAVGELAEEVGTALAPTIELVTERLRSFVSLIKENPQFAKMSADALILGIQLSALGVAISLTARGVMALAAANVFLNGTLVQIGSRVFILSELLIPLAGIGIAAFTGWKVGELISDVTGLSDAVKGLGANLGELKAQRTLGADYISESDFEKVKQQAAERLALVKQQKDAELAAENEIRAKREENTNFYKSAEEELKQLSSAQTQQDVEDLIIKFEQERQALLQHLDVKGLMEVESKESIEAEKAAVEDKYRNLTLQAEQQKHEKMSRLENESLQLYRKVSQNKIGTLTSTLEQAAQLNKGFAVAYKVLATGEAIINTALGVTKALSKGDFISAAIIAAAGAIQIATITAQSFAVGTSKVPENMTANIHKDEMIVPATFSDAIRSGELSLSGGVQQQASEGVTFDFRGAQFNGITDTLVEQIFTKASENIRNRTLAFAGVG